MAYAPNFGGGAYEKNPGWMRSPQVGGGLQYNPQYGWQRRQTIDAGLASGKPMDQWGMTVQNQGDWRKYYPGSRTDSELRSMGLLGGGKNPANQGYKAYQTAGGWYDYSNAPGQGGAPVAGPTPVMTTMPGAGTPNATPSIQPVGAPSAPPPNPLLLQQAAARAQNKYGMGGPGGRWGRGEYV